MIYYYVDERESKSGEHEVHCEGCAHLPDVLHRKFLGVFNSCKDAVEEAKRFYENVVGCNCCGDEIEEK
jgi:hypothetical protein